MAVAALGGCVQELLAGLSLDGRLMMLMPVGMLAVAAGAGGNPCAVFHCNQKNLLCLVAGYICVCVLLIRARKFVKTCICANFCRHSVEMAICGVRAIGAPGGCCHSHGAVILKEITMLEKAATVPKDLCKVGSITP